MDEVERLLEAVGAAPPEEGAAPSAADGIALRNRALVELLYAGGLRVSEALGLDRDHLTGDGWVRVIGKGDRERMVPVGDVALEWIGRYLAWPRAAWLAAAGSGEQRRDAAVRDAARRPPRPADGVGGGTGGRGAGGAR